MTSGIKGSHTPVCGLVRSVLPLQHEIRVLQATTETYQRGYVSVHFVARYSLNSPLSGWLWRSTDEPRVSTLSFTVLQMCVCVWSVDTQCVHTQSSLFIFTMLGRAVMSSLHSGVAACSVVKLTFYLHQTPSLQLGALSEINATLKYVVAMASTCGTQMPLGYTLDPLHYNYCHSTEEARTPTGVRRMLGH